MVLPVPDSVATLVSAWRAQGSPVQTGITWPRQAWIDAFPSFEGALASLPGSLDRDSVRLACASAVDSPTTAISGFLAVMAWGFGSVGYGRHRTNAILTNTPDAGVKLQTAAQTLIKEGPDNAYRRLSRPADCQLHGLGPAFGTKVLFFSQPPGPSMTALILDRLVATWLSRHTSFVLDPVPWDPPTYRRYLTGMHDWALATGVRPDELEYCMFRSIASEQGSQWA